MQSFDVVIAGGGMVGLALACGLQGSGLRVAVLEHHQPDMSPPPQQPALRVSAINAASERLLQQIGVWDEILQLRASAYNAMEVWDRDSFGKIAFSGDECGFSHLGHIIENDVIQQALWRKAQASSDLTLITPAALKQVAWGENDAFITLDDGRMLSARLVVGADGAHSWLRQHADIPLTFWDYRHSALVATIRTAEPHLATARQVFHGDGILAFLPFSDPHLCSIVWSVAPEEAERLQQLPPEQFNRELGITFDMRLGACSVESERLTFPLTGRYARNFAGHRLALVGDAAHTVHPLAGQGVNLGFMDAAELIAELKRLQRQGKDLGQHLYLRRYERRRKHGAAVMLASMQGFRELFDGNNPAKKLLRDLGLRLADSLPGVKPKLVRQAMGLNDLPEWLA
ncbi:FAD-dependent 2-octaprenylphenol hydroxylase [Serratia odorifera]|uniref:Ubiquinone biosynthesis hydroxylase, UbiH/UbiF/VisC/COQ6 family n=1 Tax=Serratia odorifera DSM 4582 TaxID=667129 RepID=D4E213_SEROD|nr:FAD-dependent 2-octaprenylphenol hydroxylase [Serratia odorifera]EFE96127.1 ubiquinone biosynthesis hydroxylase, UbiH/UbiF/VisC/COQ6 family [Serratia odorifera DSM 4582]MBJ2067936.1 FAD-dependent 2-octaprenylphenol hydroxylase [Serratia odorifera]PNK90754.1 FAD-dependent 2-octaprenylphenol hydroxylase [Serratia odorifera]RII71825.1 FAD-dependent 2-octaprenylphenol hydroxylase [Serratia odorifera]HEJ9097690.1 FAD-dependent 2-octaprenylphenol hydroxylase [Serratia odorifera]